MTKLVGLTGSIGTGKSTVSRLLLESQVPIIDADQIAHQLQQRGSECYDAIEMAFGATVTGSNAIDRQALGQIVFNTPGALQRLNRIMDPFIRTTILKLVDQYQATGAELIVLDAPLLFEAGYTSYVDITVLVTCEPVQQVQRIKARNQISTAKAIQLIAKQWPQSLKQQLSDITINNSGSISQTKQQVLKLLDNLR